MVINWKIQSEQLIREITSKTNNVIAEATLEKLCNDLLAYGFSWMDVKNQLAALRTTINSKKPPQPLREVM